MSFIDDIFDFERFHGTDLWRRLRADPKRLALGVDPLSTKLWNQILNRDDEPLVDQMGGPYGGHTISAFANKDGGVYERARDAGIDTDAGGGMHDAAHVIAAIYGAQGLAGAGGHLFGSGAGAQAAPAAEGAGIEGAGFPGGFDTSSVLNVGGTPAGGVPNFGGTPGFNPMAGGGGAGAAGGGFDPSGLQGLFGQSTEEEPPPRAPIQVRLPWRNEYVWV